MSRLYFNTSFAVTVAINPQTYLTYKDATGHLRRKLWKSLTEQEQRDKLLTYIEWLGKHFVVDPPEVRYTFEMTKGMNQHLHALVHISDEYILSALLTEMQDCACSWAQHNVDQKVSKEIVLNRMVLIKEAYHTRGWVQYMFKDQPVKPIEDEEFYEEDVASLDKKLF